MLNENQNMFLKNLKRVFTVNLLSLLYSLLLLTLLPNVLNLEQFGYWQLYLFYSNYIGLLHFGLNDGIYLRYGGFKYENLEKPLLHNQLKILLIMQVIIIVIGFLYNSIFSLNATKNLIVNFVMMLTIMINLRYFFLYVLQASNRFREYSKILTLERILLFLTIAVLIVFKLNHFYYYVIADLLSKFISLLMSLYICRDLISRKIMMESKISRVDWIEAKLNISSGSQLMLANLSSIMIIGAVRFGIEKNWPIEVFGQVSLALNISMFMLIFFNAVGIVIFPMLRRKNEIEQQAIYKFSSELYSYSIGILLIIYYAIPLLLERWLNAYTYTFSLLPLVFPVIVYEAKMSLLSNSYLKTLRKESLMLKINIGVLILSVVFTYFMTFKLNNLELSLLSILFVIAIRSIITDYYLSIKMKVNLRKNILREFFLIVFFLTTNMYFSSLISAFLMTLVVIVILTLGKENIKVSVKEILKK